MPPGWQNGSFPVLFPFTTIHGQNTTKKVLEHGGVVAMHRSWAGTSWHNAN